MDKPTEHQKLLAELDRALDAAPDEATKAELLKLKARLNSPELRDMARDLEGSRDRRGGNLALEFHDPLLPNMVTAGGCVIAGAICLYCIVDGFQSPGAGFAGTTVKLWIVAALSGAFTAMFTALSFVKSFTVRFDTLGMMSRTQGARWETLKVGAMAWPDIRSIHERADRVLEVRSGGGKVLEIPMRVVNYPILQMHLENMVRLYGDFAAKPG
ncbi:MAG: hypothetical protein H7Y89_20255 [Steroidobacteraceae bacterium]|nr:hypothetical protein [Steroidobacteraceae bacterium]